jgi:DNA polymerase-4
MARRLRIIGIETPLDFYHAPFELLKKSFGINGERWYLRLRGYEVDKLQTTRRMIGHQNTITPNPATTKAEVLSVANELTYKAAVRMRASELAATSVAVWIRYNDRTYWGRVLRTRSPFFDSRTFYGHIQTILQKWTLAKPVRLVSVTAFDLVPFKAMTHSMFDPTEKSEQLSAALDNIEHRYGRFTIRPASQLITGELSDQVGFGNAAQSVKDLEYVGG